MRFVFVSTMYGVPWGGSEELWSQAASRLNKDGHEVMASVIFWPKLSPKVVALKKCGVKISTHSSRNCGTIQRFFHKIAGGPKRDFERISKFRPDLVIISQGDNHDGLDCMNFCCKSGLPFVAILQCNSELWWPGDDITEDLTKAYRAARKVFCVSRNNLELLERQIAEDLTKGMVAWNPFNVPSGPPPAWPEDTGIWRLACVARLDPTAKGQDLLFRILALPKWRDRAIEVNLYGGGLCELNLRKLAEHMQLNMVHFRGHVDNVAAIWAQNHLLILPSRFEGLPLALVEAMWCGRPAIVTDIAGNAEMCIDGETGFVAAAPAFGLLEETLERAWVQRHEWQEMGNAARARAEKLIPKDPINEFCQQLLASASNAKLE
ncbi:MAG TPA: glycosyltransferase family 4 protein [Lacunisphaera sp.]|jgi:glycosyltransferase involved in cell wall biosynthesis